MRLRNPIAVVTVASVTGCILTRRLSRRASNLLSDLCKPCKYTDTRWMESAMAIINTTSGPILDIWLKGTCAQPTAPTVKPTDITDTAAIASANDREPRQKYIKPRTVSMTIGKRYFESLT